MTDIAELALKIDSSQARTATKDLDKFGKEGRSAEGAATSLGRSSKAVFGARGRLRLKRFILLHLPIFVHKIGKCRRRQVSALTRARQGHKRQVRRVLFIVGKFPL